MARQLFTLYCDDIRNELGGKTSYMGCYSGVMYVPSFPAALAKLCIFMKATSPSTSPFGKVTIRILLNDKVLGEQDFEPVTEPEQEEGKKRLHVIRAHFIFAPIMIPQPGVIRVRMIDESGKELRGTSLRIEEGDPDNFPPELI